jgi:hypothetical protein
MRQPEPLLSLVETIVLEEPDFESDRDVFELNRPDILRCLKDGRDPRALMRAPGVSEHEFGATEVLAVFGGINLAWATFETLKKMAASLGQATAALHPNDPIVEEIWSERLKAAGLPEALSRRIAKKYGKALLRVLETEK